jgi:hypothetical protein
MAKVMISIRDENFRLMSLEARDRGITIQELIRAVIIPEWFRATNMVGSRQGPNPIATTPSLRGETEIPLLPVPRPLKKNSRTRMSLDRW